MNLKQFFDDDDASSPMRVQRQIDAIRRCEQADAKLSGVVCNTARLRWWPGGRVDYEPTIGNADVGWSAPEQILDLVFLGRPVADRLGACPTCSQAARTELYRAVGGFDETLRRGEDTEMNIRLARAGAAFLGIQYPLVHQSVTEGDEKGIEHEERAALQWAEKHRALLEQREVYGFVTLWFRFKFDLIRGRHVAAARDLASLAARHPCLLARRLRDYHAVRRLRRNIVPDI